MEILQNTIIKLIFRQGSNTDREKVVFSSGEPVFTTDTFRLWMGNGSLSGGYVAGNLFQGSDSDITTFTSSVKGDMAFDSDKSKLYRLKLTDSTVLSSWEHVGSIYSTNDPQLAISNDNVITLNPLSANVFDPDALISPISLSSGRVYLRPLSAFHVSSDLVTSPVVITSGKIGLSSQIPPSIVSTNTITVTSGLVSFVDGNDTTGIATNPLTASITIKSNQIYARYNGLSAGDLLYSKNITSSSRLSAGHYSFTFDTPPDVELVPLVNIYGYDVIDCQARVVDITDNSCQVVILSTDGNKTDANISLLISY